MMNPGPGRLRKSLAFPEKEDTDKPKEWESIPMYQCGLCCVRFQSPNELINHVEKGEHYQTTVDQPEMQTHEKGFEKDVSFLTIDLVPEEVRTAKESTSVIVRASEVSDSTTESIPKLVYHPIETIKEPVMTGRSLTEFDEEPKNLVKREQEDFYISGDGNTNKTPTLTPASSSRTSSPCHVNESQVEIIQTLNPEQDKSKPFYKCMKCSETFSSVMTLKNHRSAHALDCLLCGDSFHIKPSLDRHVREKHGDEAEISESSVVTSFASDVLIEPTNDGCYGCKICGKVCAARSDMSKHVRRHTDERPYSCSICSDRFKHRSAITNHMRIHTGEKPYSCVYCGKKFSQPSNKRRHEALHRGERPFSCDLCKRSFSEKTTLQTHMLQHTGERPFVCDVCGKGHITNSALTQHRRSRHQSVGDPHSPSDVSENN